MSSALQSIPTRLGRYTLVRPLGAGGMAELFLARVDGIEGFSKLVALKRILPHRVTNERFVRMFLNEARLVAGLDHPNIAQVYDIGQEGGEYYFTMEYVHGPDLRRILHAAPDRRLTLENTLHVAIGLCAGLHRAHEARDGHGRSLEIVHRDVSPSNVLVSYQGAVKLVDFGVAKAATIVSETNDGLIKGKHGYMSPEQCLGEPLTRQSDVFNVGILLWEMTVGRRLYKINGDLATLQRIVYVDAPPPSRYVREYPAELERIVMRALARDPAQRYQSAEQLQVELEAFALEHRIPVSAVAMSAQMRQLFDDRVRAWQEAEAAGRSLADHLAEISGEPAVAISDDDAIDDVLAELALGGPSMVPTRADRPANLPPATSREVVALPPAPARAPARTRSRGRLAGVLLILVAGAGGALALTRPWESVDAPEDAVVARPAVEPGAPQPQPAAQPSAAADEPTAKVVADAPAEVAPAASKRSTDTARPSRPAHAPPAATPKRSKRGDRAAKVVAAAVDDAPEPPKAEPPKAEPPKAAADDAPEPPKAEPPKAEPPRGPRPGTVDVDGVREVAHAHLGEIRTCVDRARMDNRDLAGRVVIRIDVSPTGAVTRTSIAASTGANAALEACMMKTVATWNFPAPAGGVRGAFSYPFTF